MFREKKNILTEKFKKAYSMPMKKRAIAKYGLNVVKTSNWIPSLLVSEQKLITTLLLVTWFLIWYADVGIY